MDSDAAQRVRTVVRYLAEKRNTTMFEIGQLLGYSSKSAFSQMVNGKTPVPLTIPDRLVNLDPSLNIEFLLGTSNNILKEGPQPFPQDILPKPKHKEEEKPAGVFLPAELVQMVSDMTATLRSQQQTIQSQQETIRQLIGGGVQVQNVG